MSADRDQIVAKIDQLDTADEPSQRQVRDFLVEHGREHLGVLTANLAVVEGRTRRGLVRTLVDIGARDVLLPLMRFVYDTREDHDEFDARAIATKHLVDIAHPDDRVRLFDFFVDLRDDADPFVRGYVIRGLGELGDPRGRAIVSMALDDPHEFVRDEARKAQERLADATEMVHDDSPGRQELTRQLRSASGVRLKFLLEELVRHDEGFEIAVDLFFDADSTFTTAVQALRRLADPRTRRAARRFLADDRTDSERATALRLLADFIEGDATDEERRLVRRALDDRDIFVRLAGLEAAARSGDPNLVSNVIDRCVDDGLDGIETVAEGLAGASLQADERLASEILSLLDKVQLEMRHSEGKTWIMSAAYLMRALRSAAPDAWERRAEAIELVLDILRKRLDSRPIAVTALSALLVLVPETGLPRGRRWHPDDVALLLDSAHRHGDDLLSRTVELVARVADPREHDLEPWLEGAVERLNQPADLRRLIRAIREVHPPNAGELLERIERSGRPDVKKAAEAALRRIQNHRDVIEVDFRRASEPSQDPSD